MHERNPYRNGIDFASLAESYPALKPHLVKTSKDVVTIDFKDSDSQRRLTEAILARDFNIRLNLPDGRLCPPIPNRLNYVLWIQDLLEASCMALDLTTNAIDVVGVDIGTGASTIYPLLAYSLEPKWRIIGTEIDTISFGSAVEIVSQNNLTEHISIVKTFPSDSLFKPIFDNKGVSFSFTMCNPPFYGSAEEVERSAEGKILEPNAVCTGAEIEMITPGGELTFVQRMVDESLVLRDQCMWYTSMLGKLSSVGGVVDSLRSHGVDNYAVSELIQGQTRRWVVAWSFSYTRLPDEIARALPSTHHTLFPPPNSLTQSYPPAHSVSQLHTSLENVLLEIEGVQFVHVISNTSVGRNTDVEFAVRVKALANTWSRAARRRTKQAASNTPVSSTDATEIETHHSALVVLIRSSAEAQSQRSRPNTLECIWLQGLDRQLFEGFWNHVSRKIGSQLETWKCI